MKRLAIGDVMTIETLMMRFDETIVSLTEIRHSLLAAGVTLADTNLFDETRNLHHIWLGVLDLTKDAYISTDLVEIR